MSTKKGRQVLAPGNPVADFWMTRGDCHQVAAVMPHLQAATRLLDVLPVLEADFRVQVVLTTPETGYRWAGFDEFVRSLEGLVVPWEQAVSSRFDLVLAACHWGVAQLRGPAVVLPHGVGSVRSRIGPFAGPITHDLHPEHLMRGDEVVPAALVLANDDELAVLETSCPQALPYAVVAGDPCFDRMLASRPLRGLYRRALGVRAGQKLVVVSSTWSPYSLFGDDPLIFARLMAALPAEEYRVVAVLHPFIWYGHGRRQVLAWLADACAAGLVVLPPEEGWRAALVAADLLLGDHGSVSQYAAGLGIPVLMNAGSLVDVRAESTAAALARTATMLRLDVPLLPQVRSAGGALGRSDIAAMISSRPGRSAAILRRTFYGLMGIAEPTHAVPVSAVPLPVAMG